MSKPKAIWVVVSDGEVVGIYPDDMRKANEVCQTVQESGFDAKIHKYENRDGSTLS